METNTPDPIIPVGGSVRLRKVVGGLTAPIDLQEMDVEPSQTLIVEQTGQVRVLTPEGLRSEPFLDLEDAIVPLGEDLPSWTTAEERGLLGLALHPNFPDNRRFYVRYSAPKREGMPTETSHTEVLSEFRADLDFQGADPATERVLLEIASPTPIHNAGAITFGPDGYLFVAMGDGGSAQFGQDTTGNLLGSVLRLDVDTNAEHQPYSIPKDNPLIGDEGRDELFAWGLRNPWRMSFNRGTLIVADVGSSIYEEVNVVEAGGNYGWAIKEGTQCVTVKDAVARPAECPDESEADVDVESLRDPVVQYPHQIDDQIVGFAVIGGYVVAGGTIPELEGKYLFGDYSSSYQSPAGSLFVADQSEKKPWQARRLTVANSESGELDRSLLSFARGRDGALYALTNRIPPADADQFSSRTGEVLRLTQPENP